MYCIKYTYDTYHITFYSHVESSGVLQTQVMELYCNVYCIAMHIVLHLVYYHSCLRYLHVSALMRWNIINGILAQTLFEYCCIQQDSSCFII